MKIIKAPLLILLFVGIGTGQDMKPFDLTNEWLAKIENIAPSIARIPLAKKKKVLIFSLHTGYEHWTIPHTEAVMKMIGNKSNAYEMQTSKDIKVFNMKNLKKFDAIILNNNCPIDDKRNLFWDKLKEDESLNDKQRLKKADKLEQNILKYVKKGGGLVALHGGIIMQNKSPKFGEMVGGSFDYHPKQQMIQVKLMDKTHPLLQAFNGEGFK
ncbi:MAG: ThuA domain-containing protein, partial [Maribacter sp.]